MALASSHQRRRASLPAPGPVGEDKRGTYRAHHRRATIDFAHRNTAAVDEVDGGDHIAAHIGPYRAEVPHTILSFAAISTEQLTPPREHRHTDFRSCLSTSLQPLRGPTASDRGEDLLNVNQWLRLLADDDAWLEYDRPSVEALVWSGIPPSLRGRVWSRLLRSKFPRTDMRSYYHGIVSRVETTTIPSRCDIEKDVKRTLPTSLVFANVEGQAALRRLLLCYAVHAPLIGYCQGLNFIAASVLLVSDCDECQAFSLLCAIIDSRSGYYTRSMAGCMVDTAVMNDLCHWCEPELQSLLDTHALAIANFCSPWFICLFLHSPLSMTDAHRVWDLLFTFGDAILFRTGLALLRAHHGSIANITSSDRLLTLFLSELGNIDTQSMDDIIDYVHYSHQNDSHIDRAITDLREYHRFEVTAQQGVLNVSTVTKLAAMTGFSDSELQQLWQTFTQPDPWRTIVSGACQSLVHFRFSFCAAVFHPTASERFKGRGLIAPVRISTHNHTRNKSSPRLANLSTTFKLHAKKKSRHCDKDNEAESLFAAAARAIRSDEQPASPFAAPSNTRPINSPPQSPSRTAISTRTLLPLHLTLPPAFSSHRAAKAEAENSQPLALELDLSSPIAGGRSRTLSSASTHSMISTASSTSAAVEPFSPHSPQSNVAMSRVYGNVLTRLFSMLDDLSRGFVDFEQFCVGVSIFKSPNLSRRVDAAFAMADIDGKQRLTRQQLTEFLAMFHRFYHGERRNGSEVDAFVTTAFEKSQHEQWLDKDEFARLIELHPLLTHFFRIDTQ